MGSFLWHAFLDHRMISKLYHKIYNIRLIFFLFLFKSNSLSFWSISASTVLLASKSSSYRKSLLPQAMLQFFMTYLYSHLVKFNKFWNFFFCENDPYFQTTFCSYGCSEFNHVFVAWIHLSLVFWCHFSWLYACRLGINHKWFFYFLAAISQITIYRRGSFI